jgi:hypothetical protein
MSVTNEMIEELCFATTFNEAGRHFTEWMKHYEELEEAGLVRINRPRHEGTGIIYDQPYWTIEVTEQGMFQVQAMGRTRRNKPFILVFRPHQRPAWAYAYESEDEFVADWSDGYFDRSCNCNGEFPPDDTERTYDNAFADVAHDLSSLTRIDSAEETNDYINNYRGHNKGTYSVIEAASRLGWLDVDLEKPA